MKYLSLIALIVLFCSCGDSLHGSGKIVSETRKTDDFIAIDATGPVKVELRNGDHNSVVVEADDNVIKYIKTKVSGNSLKIALEGINSLTNVTVHVYVTAPRFQEVNSDGGAEVTTEGIITTDNIELKANGGSKIEAELESPKVMLSADGGAKVIAKGRAKNILLSANGGAEIKATGLQSENAKADADGGADISLFASVTLNASANGGGSIKYTGGAKVMKSEEGGGSVDGD